MSRVIPFLLLLCFIQNTTFADDFIRGDANCDGIVNNFDIDYFVNGILNIPSAYIGEEDCWNNRTKWGDINQDNFFNNFDIDSFVSCILGERIITNSGCAIKRDEIVTLTEPTTSRQFSVYIPTGFDPSVDMVIVSIHGTASTIQQEMGPHQRGSDWPDCGDPTWPELINSHNYKPFAIICPSVYFNGNNGATICNIKIDDNTIIKMLTYLINKHEFPVINSGRYSITGWSSGGSLALTTGMTHPDIFNNIVVRFSSLESISSNSYTYNVVRNCLDTSTECVTGIQGYVATQGWSNTCSGNYDWRVDTSLRNQNIYIINNTIEDFEDYTNENITCYTNPCSQCSWGNLNCNSILPFTNIQQIVYSTGRNYSPQSCDAVENGYPYGGHYEARKLAADFIASP